MEEIMKSLRVEFKDDNVSEIEGAENENWVDVCDKFFGDVHRIRDFNKDTYTGLYECFDDDNNPFYYIVEEGDTLKKLRRKNFNEKIGL